MCGIFGIFAIKNTKYPRPLISKLIKQVAIISEIRGKESSGVAFLDQEKKEIKVIRAAIPITKLLRTD